jgi:hypothetical protein
MQLQLDAEHWLQLLHILCIYSWQSSNGIVSEPQQASGVQAEQKNIKAQKQNQASLS